MPSCNHDKDLSNGWEAIAHEFIANRSSSISAGTVKNWAKSFEPGQEVLDVGCGFGGPYTKDLIDIGLKIYGVDASISLIHEYQKIFPGVFAKCEAAEKSSFYGKTFDGALSIGLIFILPEETQILVLHKMAAALKVGGGLLFSSPYPACNWDDLSTGRTSISLGKEKYVSLLQAQGLSLINEYTDEGENHYYEFQKRG